MRRRQLCCLLFLLFLAFSCGKREEDGSRQGPDAGQIIVGTLDWKEIGDLSQSSQLRDWSSAVADVDLPVMGSRCTGFLISEDILMTNQHCIPSASYARGVTVTFDHVKGNSKESWEKFDCSEFVGNDATLDYALLKCRGLPGSVYGFVDLDESAYTQGKKITIIQQNCDYYSNSNCDWTKKYSHGEITKVDSEYAHNADTLGGSSGSPVFDSVSGKVLAIHHAGLGNDGRGRGIENYAVPMSKIVAQIKRRFPHVLGDVGSTDPVDQTDVGNDEASAMVLSKSTSVEERIDAGDVDFFKITLKSGESASVTLKFLNSQGDLDLKLLDASSKVVAKSESTSDQEKVKLEAAGTYYVVVYGYRDAANDYSLVFEKSAETSGTSKLIDDASQRVFGLPAAADDLEIDSSSDTDQFGFDLKAGETLHALMKLDHQKGDLDLYLVDSGGKVVAKSESTSNQESVTYKVTKADRYFLRVAGYRGATGGYSLSAQKF